MKSMKLFELWHVHCFAPCACRRFHHFAHDRWQELLATRGTLAMKRLCSPPQVEEFLCCDTTLHLVLGVVITILLTVAGELLPAGSTLTTSMLCASSYVGRALTPGVFVTPYLRNVAHDCWQEFLPTRCALYTNMLFASPQVEKFLVMTINCCLACSLL